MVAQDLLRNKVDEPPTIYATRSDSLFVNGVVSIRSCPPALSGVVKTNVLTVQREEFFGYLPNISPFNFTFLPKRPFLSKVFRIFAP